MCVSVAIFPTFFSTMPAVDGGSTAVATITGKAVRQIRDTQLRLIEQVGDGRELFGIDWLTEDDENGVCLKSAPAT